jgi:hypothetical protein
VEVERLRKERAARQVGALSPYSLPLWLRVALTTTWRPSLVMTEMVPVRGSVWR